MTVLEIGDESGPLHAVGLETAVTEVRTRAAGNERSSLLVTKAGVHRPYLHLAFSAGWTIVHLFPDEESLFLLKAPSRGAAPAELEFELVETTAVFTREFLNDVAAAVQQVVNFSRGVLRSSSEEWEQM